ncbi:MAG TPA: hypothetical protein PLG94_11360 [Smithellaceae bacterium]|jgi:type IV secretory pathway component VirB8|nr:hypothetical protein [Smithellaceae bacterium]
MIYKYNPEDPNFRPIAILELLHQECSLPSDFKDAYQKLISDIRKEQEKRRRDFIDIAAKVLNCPVDQVEISAREIYKKKVLEDRLAEIERMKAAVVRFKMTAQHTESLRKLQQERPEANININSEEFDPDYHTMIVKGTRSFFREDIENEKNLALDYSEKKSEEASDQDLFNALRPQDMSDWARLSQEETALEQAYQKWEKVFGDGNILEFEMKSKYPEVLNLDVGSNEKSITPQEPVQFTRCVEHGLLVRYGQQYIAQVSFPKILQFLCSQKLDYNASLFIGHILKKNGEPYTKATIEQYCKTV